MSGNHVKPDNFLASIIALDVGQTVMKGERIAAGNKTISEVREASRDIKRRFRNAATAAIDRAQRRVAGSDYSMEVGEFWTTQGGDLIVCLAITRSL